MKLSKGINKSVFFLLSLAMFSLYFSGFWKIAYAPTQVEGSSNSPDSWFIFNLENETDNYGSGGGQNNPDGIPDIITTITSMNDTFLEIFVNQTQSKGGYKWSCAICNVSGVQDIGKWEYNPATDVWTYTPNMIDLYGKLTNWGLNKTWCDETNNTGFVVFGSGSGDKRYRLNFTEGHKYIIFYTGSGSDKKEVVTSRKIQELVDTYDSWWNWTRQVGRDVYFNGTQYYLQDHNVNITLYANNTLYIQEYMNQSRLLEYNENSSMYYIKSSLAYFSCHTPYSPERWSYYPIECANFTVCPNQWNKENTDAKIREIAEWQFKNKNYNVHSYIFPLYGEGILTYASWDINPSDRKMINMMKRNPEKWRFDILEEHLEYVIENYTNNNCVEFELYRTANITMNVTMPSKIVNYTIGQHPEFSKFILENYTQGNSLIFSVQPYPCCSMNATNTKPDEINQKVKVCI